MYVSSAMKTSAQEKSPRNTGLRFIDCQGQDNAANASGPQV